MREVAELLGITTAEVEAVATFYTMIRLRPTGTHLISVCTNLSCALRGANDVYEAAHRATGIAHGQDISEDGMFSRPRGGVPGCLRRRPGRPGRLREPRPVTPERLGEIVEAIRRGEVPAPARGSAPKDFRTASRVLAGLEDG